VELAALADSAGELAASEARRSAPLRPGETLDPNTASEEELDRLPGVGPSTAAAIARARDTLPFAGVADLVRVRGIGEGTLARLSPHLEIRSTVPARRSRSMAPALRPHPGQGSRAAAAEDGATGGRARTPAGMVAVNLADAEALEALPGVGPALAGRILALRATDGPFRRPADLLAVRGIGEATLERLAPFLDFRTR
jgi:competence ComEA-like helix-hairpin-helix protein